MKLVKQLKVASNALVFYILFIHFNPLHIPSRPPILHPLQQIQTIKYDLSNPKHQLDVHEHRKQILTRKKMYNVGSYNLSSETPTHKTGFR